MSQTTDDNKPVRPDILKITLNPIAGLMDDPEVTDISIYSHEKVYSQRRGKKLERVENVKWRNETALMTAAKSIARRMGRNLDDQEPILDARLPDKSRVSIITDPCYDQGACISIRKFPEHNFTLSDLARFGSIDDNGIAILEIIVRMRKNILIAGGTGSGKTTLLNSLCGFIPKASPVVTIEDAREISISNELWAAFESKKPKDSADTEVPLSSLVRASLRINPKWVIVGEVRGKEAFDLVRAFNTGHAGMGTIHANSAYDALLALESLLLQSEFNSPRAAKEMVARAIHVVVYSGELPDYSRKIQEIIEVQGLDYAVSQDNPPYKTRSLYKYEFSHYDENEKAVGQFLVGEPPSWIGNLKLLPNFKIPDFWQNKQQTDKENTK